ncbi:GntR family transcriptional regulator [Acidicapsa dinghuensis]|uniref:GntR family transcriptional regulator n=1 Tax=Acidicapsa dinghuensis TaxID=2218256 RepID=A0ABW1EPC5_9BACT|nr:GntR family transcriptional regulator [Acidicapsa dinghuensis]
MRFWFARDGEVSLHKQLVTQIIFGIVSGELEPGRRLPSTREMARRFHLHANTVNAGYRELEREGWVEVRHGSGVYVQQKKPEAAERPELMLDSLIAGVFRSAREIGVPLADVRARMQRWMSMQPPDHVLVVEPDEELRRILMTEIETTGLETAGCSLQEMQEMARWVGAFPVVLPSKSEMVRAALPQGIDFLTLKVRSIPESLTGYLPAPTDLLIGVASRWGEFLRSCRTMLVAAGFDSENLVVRDAREPGWLQDLEAAAVVVCDGLIAAELKGRRGVISFSVVSEESLQELRRYRELLLAQMD